MDLTMLTGAAGRAYRSLDPVINHIGVERDAGRTIINAARGDLVAALGAERASSLSAQLHAGFLNLHSGNAESGMRALQAGSEELWSAAYRTAAKRVGIGLAVGVGAAIGASLLHNALSGGPKDQPMAPGPFRAPGFDPSWVKV